MDIAQRHAIPCLELRTLGGTVDLPDYLASQYGCPEMFAGTLLGAPARIVSLGTSLQLVGNTAESRNAFLRYVPWAEACGASTLRAFDGGRSGSDQEIEQALSTWMWWRSLRADRGWNVDIAVETHDAFAIEDNLRHLSEALPDCRLIWDTHHTWRKGGCDPIRTWRLIGDRVQHIHVKDSRTDANALSGYSYVLPGDGEFPMSALLAALRDDDYRGAISLEWERHWYPDLPPLEYALTAARQRNWW
ncbi:TIM barrel protein [Burkholderia sp. Nafp2/4-1b]|uniref:sugar phosphate isomerase/epimerase family protein n=1 Tax=Burkholderia sp. Nafp2/4-1b TaxID=2116686 RepID=UPI001969A43B|nr:TIM barrel protein [Burkholderia sp. Nafp2/4-1b]